MSQSNAEWIERVVVAVAHGSGRSLREVANESFALVLWAWMVQQRAERERNVERLGERTDLAGLMAVAFHQPGDLQKAEMRYLRAAGRLSPLIDAAKARALATMQTLEPQARTEA